MTGHFPGGYPESRFALSVASALSTVALAILSVTPALSVALTILSITSALSVALTLLSVASALSSVALTLLSVTSALSSVALTLLSVTSALSVALTFLSVASALSSITPKLLSVASYSSTAFFLLSNGLKKLYKLICLYSSSCYFDLLSIVFAIQSPWKRPFSIKISLALFPAAITPAINKPSTFVSIVSGLKKGRPVS